MNVKYILPFVLILIVGTAVFFYGERNDAEDRNHNDGALEAYEISPSDAADKIGNKENIILLDVRTPEEYEEAHLENALLLPVENLSQQTLNSIGLGEDAKNREIIIYCRSGARSKIAYDIMSSLGYANVKSVAGGMIHWQEDNYPFIEKGEYKGIKFEAMPRNEISGPKIKFDRVLHDFGIVPQYGGVVETIFIVRNEGADTLEIGEITTSCGCTAASISSFSIPKGGQAELTVVFDPDFHEEPADAFKRTIFVPTNDPNAPEAEVVIQVDIEEGK